MFDLQFSDAFLLEFLKSNSELSDMSRSDLINNFLITTPALLILQIFFLSLLFYFYKYHTLSFNSVLTKVSCKEFNFFESWKLGKSKIVKLSKFEKFMTVFWLLGPFVYLIERDPADLWLSSIGLTFLIKCCKDKNWSWVTQSWFKYAFVFWLICIISSLNSPYIQYSLKEAFLWIRFPLYAAAAQFWIGKDKDIRIIMFLSILIGSLYMCFILFFEVWMFPKPRLMLPYGDYIPGSYLTRIALPLILVFTFIIINSKRHIAFYTLYIFTIILAVIFTGERTNLLLILCSINLLLFLSFKNFKRIIFFLLLEIIFVSFFLVNRIDNNKRTDLNFYNHIPILNQNDKNPYWGVWRSGIQQILEKPILGIGPGATRKNCKKLSPHEPKWLPGKNHCNNHPHNFYIQIFAETGIFGFVSGCIMFFMICFSCYRSKKQNLICSMSASTYLIPISFFFPLQQFGNFFGQWGNLFIWFGLGLALACRSKNNIKNH